MAATVDPCVVAAIAGERYSPLPPDIVELESREVGVLSIPTGLIVAPDPLVITRQAAFEQRTPTGHFPVRLLIVHYEGGDQRIAAAILDFAIGNPDRWVIAVMPGDDPSTLGPDRIFGYGVDSGTGSFMDEETAERLEARVSGDWDDSDEIDDEIKLEAPLSKHHAYCNKVWEEMQQTYIHTRFRTYPCRIRRTRRVPRRDKEVGDRRRVFRAGAARGGRRCSRVVHRRDCVLYAWPLKERPNGRAEGL